MADENSAETILAEMNSNDTADDTAQPEDTQVDDAAPEEAQNDAPDLVADRQEPQKEADKQKPAHGSMEYLEEQNRNLTHALRRQERDNRQRLDRLQSAFDQMQARPQTAPAAPPTAQALANEPDAKESPVEYIEWLQAQQQAQAAQAQQQAQAQAQQEAQMRAQQQAVQQMASDLTFEDQMFTEQYPDYPQAVDHLTHARVQELMMMGFNQQQALDMFKGEVLQFSHQIKQQGGSPQEVAYKMAKARGYRPGGSDRERMEMHRRGVKAANKTAGPGSRSASGGITLKEAMDLPGKDFDKFMDKLIASEMR